MVSISSVQFARPEEINPWALFALELVREFHRPFLNLILIILFFFLVVRPLLNWLKGEVEPAGFGAQPAVLPDQPGSGFGYGDGLPMPLPPQAQAPVPAAAEEGETAVVEAEPGDMAIQRVEEEVPAEDLAAPYEGEAAEELPDYEVEYEGEEEAAEEEEAPGLTYGNLSRENVLPLALDNIGRTVDLLRNWIDQRPGADGGKPSS